LKFECANGGAHAGTGCETVVDKDYVPTSYINGMSMGAKAVLAAVQLS
jgi:hypothetical protein